MSEPSILLTVENDVAVLTLNRPQSLNATTNEMVERLRGEIDKIASGETKARALIITGAGRGFCAGADLPDITESADFIAKQDAGLVLELYYNALIKALRALPVPIVAAVNGPCAGVGMSFALAADVLVAARSASFLQAFVNIGLVPDGGSSYFLPRSVGRTRAARMMLLGEKIGAEEAYEWGLVTKLVDDEALMDEAMKIARKFASGPTRAINLIRQMMDASERNSLSDQLDLERASQKAAGEGADFKEGVKAFFEKRKPVFTGQ